MKFHKVKERRESKFLKKVDAKYSPRCLAQRMPRSE